jgi:ABC-type cobalt transport system substrate-binding protein
MLSMPSGSQSFAIVIYIILGNLGRESYRKEGFYGGRDGKEGQFISMI